MNKKILIVVLCLVLLLVLTACAKEKADVILSSKYVELEVIEDYGYPEGEVLVDRSTGVLYLLYYADSTGQTITPLFNADGTLKNIKDF